MFGIWLEARHPGVLGCHEERLRVKLFWITFTLWQWEVD